VVIRTSFTELVHVDHPLVLAPMGGVSGGALAAAVSEAGGLGLVGGGYGDPGWLERELRTVAGATDKPWGVGVITWAAEKGPTSSPPSSRPGN
jgi:nitronate monooxygenase